jgi:hypothetical protein
MEFIETQLLAGIDKNDQHAGKCSAQSDCINQKPLPILFYPPDDLHVFVTI